MPSAFDEQSFGKDDPYSPPRPSFPPASSQSLLPDEGEGAHEPIRIGSLVSKTFSLWLVQLAPGAMIFAIPAAVDTTVDFFSERHTDAWGRIASVIATALVLLPLSIAARAGAIRLFLDALYFKGPRMWPLRYLLHGFRFFGRIFLFDLIVMLATFGVFSIPAIVSIFQPVAGALLAGLAVFPMIYILLRWFVAVPVIVTRDASTLQAMGRSSSLTRGHKTALLGSAAVCHLAIYGIPLGVYIGRVLAAEHWRVDAVWLLAAGWLLTFGVSVVFSALSSALSAAAYAALNNRLL